MSSATQISTQIPFPVRLPQPAICSPKLRPRLQADTYSASTTTKLPAPSKRSSSSLVTRKQRRTSLLRTAPTKPPCSLPWVSQPALPSPSKKKTRPPLQAIHVRALEHGLRVPVINTPLGTTDQAENIACTPTILQRSVPVLPLLPVRLSRPTTPTSPPKPSTRSAPQSPSRAPRVSRRNSIACVRPALVFNL
ncbi:hypothetical protein GGI25_000710 [Coemansia spiralis]|uniref:Uncharacterized protein n=2 Tax=Coemansia TaxID=4863 RepID=A0A9W8GEB4_9FUNG|nr:hypothetical protein EDC05_000667 [Coemansia umbellata]KAJ2623663.1 hypothetical protein GGI26_002110 [Coemansia sp. RSA 1358]KAJ2680418.1 hypothetical protein GGI25_000710 [Coemansia spiralis]